MPTFNAYLTKSPTPALLDVQVYAVGGTTAITAVTGTAHGWSIAYVDTGIYRITFDDALGTFLGAQGGVMATTQGDVKAFVVIPGDWSATARTLDIHMFESGSLADLAASEWLVLRASFRLLTV